jgi:hypothetical protein
MTDDLCECASFEEGDWVECKLNTNLFGIVLSQSDWGRYYNVQLAGSLEVRLFHWATIRHCDELDEGDGGGKVVPEEESNVIDFTKARDLRTAKTKGAA